jgi:chromosomal replication initiator protein
LFIQGPLVYLAPMENIWQSIRQNLANIIQDNLFKVWIAPLEADFDGQTLTLKALNEFVCKFVRRRFQEQILQAAALVLGLEPELKIVALPKPAPMPAPAPRSAAPEGGVQAAGPAGVPALPAATPLYPALAAPRQAELPVRWGEPSIPTGRAVLHRNWRFRFDDFIVGPCNDLAYAAARGLCRRDCCRTGSAELLFLCSEPGLGKTHLVQSVGAGLLEASNLAAPRVEYLTAEEFATLLRQTLRSGDIDRFKARFREADVLLLEDVHFLLEKEKTQHEVLATLSALLERGSRVVLSSSFALPELRKMDSRLFSRISSGLIAAIERPDLETRRRIIRHKAASSQVLLSDDVTDYLAENINSDVRQIESCLRNLALKASLLRKVISLDMAREVVGNYLSSVTVVTWAEIVRQVCAAFGISTTQLGSKSRKADYVQARNAVYCLARKHTDLSLQDIGKRLGGRTHSTVIKGITAAEREVSRQSHSGRQFAGAIAAIERSWRIDGEM